MCGGGGSDSSYDKMRADEEARKAEVAKQISVINGIMDSNRSSGIYDQARQAVFDLDKFSLDEQRTNTERASRFALARQGLSGGSQEVDRNKALQDVYNQGLLQADQRANKLKADWMSSDEDLRNSLIKQVTADPQALNAEATQAQLSAAAESRKNSGIDSSLADLFSKFENVYALSRYSSGVNSSGYSSAGGGVPTVSSARSSYQGR